MASNILSRLLPSASDEVQKPARSRQTDLEAADAESDHLDSDPPFEDQDLEQLLAEGIEDDMPITDDARSSDDRQLPRRSIKRPSPKSPPARITVGPSRSIAPPNDDDDDDVPASLLLGGKSDRRRKRKSSKSAKSTEENPLIPAPGPETRTTRAQWEATKAQQQLHNDLLTPPPVQPVAGRGPGHLMNAVNPREKAMWSWTNVDNLDSHLDWVYRYYEQHGVWSYMLNKIIRYLTAIFVFWLSTFMLYCIDYSKLPGSTKFSQIRDPQCYEHLPWYWNLFIWIFALTFVYKFINEVQTLPRWWEMHNFYTQLLEIPDKDVQTVSWQFVVSKLMELRDANPTTAQSISPANRRWMSTQSKQRMDAHDIANRLMRRDNYWIAMINKDVLDFSVNIPFFGKKDFYPYALQYFISLCLMDCVFDDRYQVKENFRNTRNRKENIELLQRRFKAAGFISMILAVPLAFVSVIIRFLETYTEYQKNPTSLSIRKFSYLAEWKIRDFNEVSHLFDRRKRMVYAFANRYLDQFPKDKTNQVLRFAAFIMGSLAAILGVVTLVDPDLFLGFEISGKTSLFWLSIFSTLALLCRNGATDEDDDLWDPEIAMNAVIVHSHYCPDSWKGRLHSDEVRQEFSSMYKLEALLFLEDIIGTLLTPWLLMYNLPNRADRLVDFFREFTIHVDGLGTVCSYAVFDFKNGGKAATRPGQPGDLRDGYYGDKANKLMESYLSFLDVYGPNPKRGLHGRTKRHFHPPPTFPGLAGGSPSILAENHSGSAVGRHGTAALMRHSTLQQQSQPQQQQPQQHTPRFGPAGSSGFHQQHISPMHSILLDPHHQPRSSPRQGPTSRPPLRSGGGGGGGNLRHTLDGDPAEVVEEDEDVPAQNRLNVPRTSSNLIEEDSELGDSWLLRGGLAEDNGANLSGGEKDRRGERGGVLGMLRELQKAQTEDRGGHI